ncbi:MAG TPA: hypothetical protein VKV02_07165 [Acidobacteriaceae bacterium]|jgi:hypothetical protein|nr:hypothetical protein [Acidobacteriaceae bacterium]
MDVYLGSQDGAAVGSVPQTLATVAARLEQEQQRWRERLQQDPTQFGEVEIAVHHTFQELADQVVASLLGAVGQSTALEQASKKSR